MLSVRLCVCVCVCVCVALHCRVQVCECARGGRLEAKINGAVFGCIPVEHLHQSRGLLAALLERTCVSVCVCVCVCVCVNVCMHTRRSETGKIESAKALPYHQFTVPLFPFQRVCVSWCKSSLYMRCCRALSPLLQPTEVSLRQIFVLNE